VRTTLESRCGPARQLTFPSALTIRHHWAEPARAPSGRVKRVGKINFILAKTTLKPTKYARREEAKRGRKEKAVDRQLIFLKHC
jgi:hypothetical protein